MAMAAYNLEPYIGVAMESILNQTMGDLKLIVVDDGSTDGTAARNVAIAHAQSDFVVIIDGNDITHLQRLEKQFSFLIQNPQYAAASCRCELIDGAGERMKIQSARKPLQEAGRRLEELRRGQILVNQTAMIRILSLGWLNEIYRPRFRMQDFYAPIPSVIPGAFCVFLYKRRKDRRRFLRDWNNKPEQLKRFAGVFGGP